MHLVAVCTGKTRAVEIQGATIQTAYLKAQVRGPCFIGHAGPEGNETAVHPDTVYAIAREHYDYWAQRLGSRISQSGYGYFAENLTIAGLDEQALRVGDVLLIGSTVQLIVTGPRIPCFKVAWRMQQPQAFVRDFAESGRTGVYFAVRQPGMIEAGDAVEVIHREIANPTVATLGAVARGAVEITTAALARLLALPYLSKTAALLLGGIYYRLLDQPDQTRHWEGWRDFVVLDVKDETDAVKSFELAPADAGPLPRFAAGQYVTVRFADSAGREFVRPWSLSSYSREPGSFRITVKREDRGGASAALHAGIHFKALFYYSQPGSDDAQTPHQAGRLTADRLIEALADLQIELAGKTIPVPWYETDIYLCGPTSFLEQIHADLIQRGARAERLKMEYFLPHAHAQAGDTGVPQATVTFARSGSQTSWRQSENPTLLQLASSLGLDLPFSCRSGYCGTCQCRIVEGEVRYEYAPLCDAPPGHVLLCCARPASPALILDA